MVGFDRFDWSREKLIENHSKTIGFNNKRIDSDRLQEARIKCLHAIIQSDFFVSNPLVQSKMAECLANQLSQLLLDEVKTELTVKFLQGWLFSVVFRV